MVTRTKKIFVGGLSAPTTLEDVKSYFEQFGPVSNFIKYFNTPSHKLAVTFRESFSDLPFFLELTSNSENVIKSTMKCAMY